MAEVDATGVYVVEAESEAEAREIFENWLQHGDDTVSFCHYAEEYPGDIKGVEELQ